jgi:hypothetical protein
MVARLRDMTQCVYRDAAQLAIRVGSGQAVRLPPVGVGLMRARLALSVGCTMAALGGLFPACASSESTSVQDAGGAEVDSTTPEDGGGDVGQRVDSATGADVDAGRSDARADADATVTDAGAGDGASAEGADGGTQDATVADTTTTDTGGEDSTADMGAMDGGGDSATADAGGVDADAGDGAADAGEDAPGDSGADTGAQDADSGTDTGADAGSDAGQDTGAGLGPVCQRPDGGNYFCSAGQHCCGNSVTRDSVCATACNQGAGYYPIDCPGASGDGGCGPEVCCATLVLDGGTVPNCTAAELTSACVSSCSNDSPPGTFSMCLGTYTILLCTAAADCAGDPNGNTMCCNFGTPPSPVNWCINPASGDQILANTCL